VAGAKKLGSVALDWVKGDPHEQLAAALAGRVTENDFQLVRFDSLVRDEKYVNFISDTRQTFEFDEDRAAYIVRGHVGDIRGETETDALVGRVVDLLRALLPTVVERREAIGLQTALQHQDSANVTRAVEANQQTLNSLHDAMAQLQAAEAQRMQPPLVVESHWFSGRASDAWTRLLESDAREALELRQHLGEEPTAETVGEYLARTDRAPPAVWETVVSVADELGKWDLVQEAALRYADADGSDRVRGLAWAASAADGRGDDAARDELMRQARELNDRHPSLLLMQARTTRDPHERLQVLERVEPLNEQQAVVLEAVRAHAFLEAGDADAAYVAVRSAKGIDPDDVLAAEIEAALLVEDARRGKGLTWENAMTVVENLSRVRDRLRAAKRFNLSVEVAGKIAQAYLLFGGGPNDVASVATDLAPEERVRDETALLAAALLATDDGDGALELLPQSPETEYARYVFASALLKSDPPRFRRDGIAILDELLEAEDLSLRPEAAWLRAGAAVLDEPAPESEEALAVLDEHDPIRARLIRAAVAERKHGDPVEAEAILSAGGEQAELLIERGRLAAKADNWEDAIALYRRASQLDPTPTNELAFADALLQAGQREAALEEALRIARRAGYPPYVRRAAYRLAYGLTQRSGDLEKQADLAEEWLTVDDANLELLWSYVWVLARLARYREARSLVDRNQLHPTTAQEAEPFADVLVHTSPAEEALSTLLPLLDELPGELPGLELRIGMLGMAVDNAKVDPKLVARAANLLETYPDRYAGAAVQKVELDPGDPLRDIRPILEERARAAEQVAQALRDGEAPLAALAATTGRDIGALLLELNVIPLGFGIAELDALELADARDAIGKPVVWESTAINVAGGLGERLFERVRGAFQTPTVAQAVVDDARLGARDAMTAEPTATLGLDPSTGEVFYREYAPGEREREGHRAATVLDLFKDLTVVPNVDEQSEGDIGKWIRENGHLDNPALATAEATLAVVERVRAPLYSDDPVLRVHAKSSGCGAFGTPTLLRAMSDAGMIEAADFDGAIATLLRTGAQGIPVDAFDPVRAARSAGWAITEEIGVFMRDERRWNNDFEANLERWQAFLRVAFAEASFRQFEHWVFRFVDAMMLALPQNDPEHILAIAAISATTTPIDEQERKYRERLLSALNFVRQFYGVDKRIGVLVMEWRARTESVAPAEEHPEDDEAPRPPSDETPPAKEPPDPQADRTPRT
jgi:uncharacterized protein HemY